MKKNGFTLVELLVTLALVGMVIGILGAVFSSGLKQGVQSKKDIFLQEEANNVATSLRRAHLNQPTYTILVSNNAIALNGVTISDKYQYQATIKYNNTTYTNNQTVTITSSSPVMIEITFIKDNSTYKLRTTLSRGV